MMSEVHGEDIVKKAVQRGCDAAEVFIKKSLGISVEAKEGKVDALEASRDFGIALKVIKDKKIGFSFTTSTDDIDKIIKEALEGAQWTSADEFVDIPEHLSPGNVSVYDENVDAVKEDEIIKSAIFLEDSALKDDERVKRVRKAEISAGTGHTSITNSRGVNESYKSSYYVAHVTALAQDEGGDSQMGWGYASSRRVSDVDLRAVGKDAAKRATELLGSRKISAVKVPVILHPSVAVDFLDILSGSLSSESVQKQRSFLTGKVGQNIVSGLVDIIDDGTLPWGTGTKPVDDEGVPTMNKTLISEGILKGYIYNTYTAKKGGGTSTGNAVRGGFKSLPGVGVTNFFIKPSGSGSCKDLVSSLPKGILILGAMGVHTANPISGDFSVGISGLWIENGEPAYPIKEAVLSGNILDMFKKVEAVGSDLVFYGNTGSPSLLTGDMDVSA